MVGWHIETRNVDSFRLNLIGNDIIEGNNDSDYQNEKEYASIIKNLYRIKFTEFWQ